jgi:hypothetical protein
MARQEMGAEIGQRSDPLCSTSKAYFGGWTPGRARLHHRIMKPFKVGVRLPSIERHGTTEYYMREQISYTPKRDISRGRTSRQWMAGGLR